jgi:hypothetical protein
MARDVELKNLVDEYLYLVEVGSGATVADESELEHLLDRLALALRTLITPAEPERPVEVPARNLDVLRKVAASRFPNYGSYRCPGPGADATPIAANAIEDVTSIADHLHAVAWLWRNASFEVGLWYLDESYREQWGRALRTLQLYLHDRRAASDSLRERRRETQ